MTASATVMAKQKVTAVELLARVESNGYKRGARRENNNTRDQKKYTNKTKRGQDPALDRYILQDIDISSAR